MIQPGRKYQASSSKYRYGFNGKENDNDVSKGEGGQQDYGMRIYDPRLCRFLSVDPITSQFPELTPYQFASNRPIVAIDLDGLEAWDTNDGTDSKVYGPISNEAAESQGLTPAGSNPSQNSAEDIGGFGQSKLHEPWEEKREIINTSGVIGSSFKDESGNTITLTGMQVVSQNNNSIGQAEGSTSVIPGYGSGRNSIDDFQNGRYISGTFNGIMGLSDVFLLKSLISSGAKALSKTVTVTGYHATESKYASSIIETGLNFSTKGRVGPAKYLSQTPETALSELLYHRPALSNVTIVELQYQVQKPLLNLTSLPKVSYKLGNRAFLKANVGGIIYNSLRTPGVNYALKDANYIGGSIFIKF